MHFEIDRAASVFAVVTHKAGLAARLAHNHLVVAEGYEASLTFDAERPTEGRFELSAPSARLVVDDPGQQAAWGKRLVELGILDELFGELSEKDRSKIRKSMVGKDQLAVEAHREIRAKVIAIEEGGTVEGFPFVIELEIEIVGKTVTRPVAGRYRLEGERLVIEAFGELRFSDFGIEPYSAMLGAVKNDDPFHLFLHLEATVGGASGGSADADTGEPG